MKTNKLACSVAIPMAILSFISNGITPEIAYSKDALAKPLGDKLREAIKNVDENNTVVIEFPKEEDELFEQFVGVVHNISFIFDSINASLISDMEAFLKREVTCHKMFDAGQEWMEELNSKRA